MVAVKIIDKKKCDKYISKVYQEIDIIKKLRHTNVIELLDSYETIDFIYLVMDLSQVGCGCCLSVFVRVCPCLSVFVTNFKCRPTLSPQPSIHMNTHYSFSNQNHYRRISINFVSVHLSSFFALFILLSSLIFLFFSFSHHFLPSRKVTW